MKTIWRHELELTEKQTITAPGLQRIIHLDDRRGAPEVWFPVDTDQPDATLTIWIQGTGQPAHPEVVEKGPRYAGVFFTGGGQFVWHVFCEDAGDAEPSDG